MTQFIKKNENLLAVHLAEETVLSRAGSMVAYEGKMKFTKEILGGEGLFGALKRRLVNEKEEVMSTKGQGIAYYALDAKQVSVISLQSDKIYIESTHLLAYDSSLNTNVAFAGLHGASSGQGFFTTTVEGTGNLAIVSMGDLIALEVTPATPLCIDPDAFIAYTGDVERTFKVDVNWKTMIGQESGESYQIQCTGQGVVYIQPSEI